MNIKLRQIGNSLGFSLPKDALLKAGFSLDDEYDIDVSDGAIVILRKGPSNKTWKFSNQPLNDESRAWIENELGQPQ